MYRFISNKSTFLFFASSSLRQTFKKPGSRNTSEPVRLTTTSQYSLMEPRAAARINTAGTKIFKNCDRLQFGDESLEIALNTKTPANGENENISFVNG